jgi:Protein of unknown function (DUF992)
MLAARIQKNGEEGDALFCRALCTCGNCMGRAGVAQQVKAGVLTCDVSEGMGYIIGSQKLLSCSFGLREQVGVKITTAR